jgi:phage terminase large subunit-like protein
VYNPFDFDALYQQAKRAVDQTKSTAEWEKNGYQDQKAWETDFRKYQMDLYALSVDLLGLDIVEETHRPITDDFFVKKNPYIEAKNWKDAVSKQSTIKNRLLLYPRGSFKSSIDRADVVQWLICFPQIETIYMTAEETLASEFVQMTRSYFAIDSEAKLTRFQMLYFAHCVPAKTKESEDRFTSRAKNENVVTPSIRSLSLGASTVGKHGQVGKFDDCVSNKNSGPTATPEQRKKVTEEIKLARNIIDGFGYRDYVGTNYDLQDAYASLEETLPNLKVLRKPAWTVKAQARKKKIEELVADDVDLLFPLDGAGVERLTFEAIMAEYKVDSFICSCQLLLNPTLTKTVKFTDQMLRKQIIPSEQFPQDGTYFVVDMWDLAATDGVKSDRSCGMVGKFTTAGPYAGRVYICDIIRGRYSKSELPFQIANQASRWKPLRSLAIEKPPAHDFLENDIIRALSRVGYGDCPAIEWIAVENTKGAKNERAAETEILLVNNQIFFSADIPEDVMNEVIKEHVNFKAGTNRKDDSVDTLARLARYLPKEISVPQTEQERQNAAWDLLKQKQSYEKQFLYRENETAGESKTPDLWKTDGYDRREEVVPAPTHYEGLPIRKDFDSELFGL